MFCDKLRILKAIKGSDRQKRQSKAIFVKYFFGIYRTVSYASETLYKQDTCLSVFIVFGEVAEDGVSKPCKKKTRVSRSFNRQNTYFFDLTLSANEIPPFFFIT